MDNNVGKMNFLPVFRIRCCPSYFPTRSPFHDAMLNPGCAFLYTDRCCGIFILGQRINGSDAGGSAEDPTGFAKFKGDSSPVPRFAYQSAWKLRFDDELALHPAMAESATVAAVKRIRSRSVSHKFHYRWNPGLDPETVVCRSEDEAWIAFGFRSVGVEIDLEAVRLVERRDFQLHFGPRLYVDGRRAILIFFGGDFDDLHALVRGGSSRRTGEVCGECEPA
jgi:hypothetical protein